jgi:hypothetical protein
MKCGMGARRKRRLHVRAHAEYSYENGSPAAALAS